jgi:starch phosphorylase
LPAAKAYLERSCGNGKAGKLLVEKKKAFEQHWQSLRFGDSRVTTEDGRHTFTTQVHLGQLCVDDLRVELYAEAYQSGFAERHAMQREMLLKAEPSSPIFTISLPAARKAEDYTVRILPKSETLSVPLELPFILWQR